MSEKITVSFDDFVKYYVKKWKVSVLVILVCTAVFAVGSKFLGEEISSPPSEEFLYYEKESAWLEQYLKESVLMQINPTSVQERTLHLKNMADQEALKEYVFSKEAWQNYVTDRNTDYFYELLDWQEGEDGEVQLTIRHVTEEECLDAAEYLKNRLETQDVGIEITIGAAKLTKDEELQDEQLRWYDRIDYSKSLLLDAQAGYTITVSTTVSAICGIAFGALVSVIVNFVSCIRERSRRDQEKTS